MLQLFNLTAKSTQKNMMLRSTRLVETYQILVLFFAKIQTFAENSHDSCMEIALVTLDHHIFCLSMCSTQSFPTILGTECVIRKMVFWQTPAELSK